MKEKRGKLLYIIIIGYILMYFSQLFDFSDKLAIIIGVSICSLLIFKTKYYKIDIELLLILILVSFYYIIDKGLTKAISRPTMYITPLIYSVSFLLSCDVRMKDDMGIEKKNSELLMYIVSMIIGLTIHGILNSYTFLAGQLENGNIRVWADFWTNYYVWGTLQVVYYFGAIAMVCPIILCYRNKRSLLLFFVMSTGLFMLISMLSQTRTAVLMLPIIAFIQSCLYFMMDWKALKSKITARKIVIVLLSVGVVGTLVLCSSIGKSFIEIMGRDGGIFNNVRFQIQRHALKQLFIYPMGGNQMDFLGRPHPHNAWLDVAGTAGVVPFFAFILYTIVTLKDLVCMLRKGELSKGIKLIFVGFYMSFLIFYMIEPALDFSVHLFTPWIYMHGLLRGWSVSEEHYAKKN